MVFVSIRTRMFTNTELAYLRTIGSKLTGDGQPSRGIFHFCMTTDWRGCSFKNAEGMKASPSYAIHLGEKFPPDCLGGPFRGEGEDHLAAGKVRH